MYDMFEFTSIISPIPIFYETWLLVESKFKTIIHILNKTIAKQCLHKFRLFSPVRQMLTMTPFSSFQQKDNLSDVCPW